MKIKSITIGNYKNIGESTLQLGQIVALVSTNNYGKSNLLEAIDFGFDFIAASPKSRRKLMGYIKAIPLCPALAGEDFIFQIEFEDPNLKEYRFVRYGFRFSWPNDWNTGARITDETLEMRPSESIRYTSYLKREEGKYRASKASSSFRKLELPDNVLAIDIIPSLEKVEIAEVISVIREIKSHICDSLEVDNSFRTTPIEIDMGDAVPFPFDDADIPRALSQLQKDDPKRFDLFIETVQDLFPEFRRVELQEYRVQENMQAQIKAIMVSSEDGRRETEIPYKIRDNLYRLTIDSIYLNQPLSMENMSTGTKRILWLIANAVYAGNRGNVLLGVDEVETSIHPKMMESLLSAMVDILGDSSLLITSHSPYLIQYLKPASIYIGAPGQDGVARFKRVASNKTKMLVNAARERNLAIGEYIFEMLSGDEDAADTLSAYLDE